MEVRAEPTNPPQELIDAVEECAKEISPDDVTLAEWYQSYVNNHARRIAFYLDLVEQYARTSDRLLELGAVPLLLTAPLARRGHSVTGVDIDRSRFASSISDLHLDVVACDIENDPLPIEDHSFDIAIYSMNCSNI